MTDEIESKIRKIVKASNRLLTQLDLLEDD